MVICAQADCGTPGRPFLKCTVCGQARFCQAHLSAERVCPDCIKGSSSSSSSVDGEAAFVPAPAVAAVPPLAFQPDQFRAQVYAVMERAVDLLVRQGTDHHGTTDTDAATQGASSANPDSHPEQQQQQQQQQQQPCRASHLVSIDNIADQKDALALSARLTEQRMPQQGTDVERLLNILFEDCLEQGMNHNHPGFMAFIGGGGLPAAAVGHFAAEIINRYTGVWMAVPGMVQLEVNAIHWLCEVVGYGSSSSVGGGGGGGGGSGANKVPDHKSTSDKTWSNAGVGAGVEEERFPVPLPSELQHNTSVDNSEHKNNTNPSATGAPFGLFTSGGSQANFTAIFTARRVVLGDDDMHKGTCYVSTQTHHCVQKGAMLAGFPLSHVRAIPVEATTLRIDIKALQQQLDKDVEAGLRPFFIAANGGTTNTGAVDDVCGLAAVARTYHCWLHVDACYGGLFRLTHRGRQLLQGLHLADSVSVDCHKSLFLPHGIGALLVRNQHHLLYAHMLNGGYMPQTSTAQVLSFCDLGMELTRPPRGVAVWFVLKLYGAEAFARTLDAHMDACVALHEPSAHDTAALAKEKTRALLCAINAKGRVFLSPTTLPSGAYVIRVCILGYRTSMREVTHLVEDIQTSIRDLGMKKEEEQQQGQADTAVVDAA